MLADFVSKLVGLVESAQKVNITAHPELPRKLILQQGSEHEEIDIPPKDRKHKLIGYADVLNIAKRSKAPEIFCSDLSLYVHLDREDRREVAHVLLDLTDRWTTVLALRNGVNFSVKDVVRFLRFKLHATGLESVVRALSKIDFTRKSDGGATVDHGRESLGRRVEASVQQAEEVPRSFSVSLPIFCNPGFRSLSTVDVEIGVYLDLDDENVCLTLLPDESSKAMNTARAAIVAKLAQDLPEVPIYEGTP